MTRACAACPAGRNGSFLDTNTQNDAPQAAIPLGYAPPEQGRRSRRDMWWGIVISVFLANGVGWLTFGFLMMQGMRDDHAGPMAVGLAFITLGCGLAGMLYWTRQHRRMR